MGLIKKRLITILMDESDEIIEREAKNFGGNASHVILPAKHRNKKVIVICASNHKIENGKK